MQNGTLLAGVDLGSNSFRLEIGRFDHGQISRIEYIKETVRQGNGLDADRNLTKEAMQRGWDCLGRFAERLGGFKKSQVRAVATQTLREARNRDEFLEVAQKYFGFPIEVISGREEARLIYLGVAHLLPNNDDRRLVIDIGGRSTEFIIGSGLDAQVLESYRVGSVAWSMRFFEQGEYSTQAFKTAEVAAKAILDEAVSRYPRHAWDIAYGSSGTVGAVADILGCAGWPPTVINRDSLNWLKRTLIRVQFNDKLRLEGLKEERKAVLGGGISVLSAVFDLLEIDELHLAQGALRHGVLYDMLDRSEFTSDARTTTIARLSKTSGLDSEQAERVKRVGQYLLDMLIDDNKTGESKKLKQKLDWAASLHEIGTLISHSDYHKHGAYILDNTDAPGFAGSELHRISLLVLGHRGKLRKLEADFNNASFIKQLISLRLAVILCHAKRDPEYKSMKLSLNEPDRAFKLYISKEWAEKYPQSTHLLREEITAWQKTTWTFELEWSEAYAY
jgi:exopolyphosphatase/guanosine-5'-triphosphate,3'-diphosphate pyrophosphatase